ncbi:hypothetical protein IMZ48_16035 [Candidatus Bathyarchaeota archaeon]|nr:hypothetical protein [Candidatus Bathyarchaeota archaeon]
MALPLVLQFILGFALQLNFTASPPSHCSKNIPANGHRTNKEPRRQGFNTLLVDLNPRSPSAAKASTSILRCTLSALVIAFQDDLFHAIGVG